MSMDVCDGDTNASDGTIRTHNTCRRSPTILQASQQLAAQTSSSRHRIWLADTVRGTLAGMRTHAPAPTRVVLDTNVWLDVLVFADPRCTALRSALDNGHVRPLLRDDCHAEWLRVLTYPALRLDQDRRTALAEAQRRLCEWVAADRMPPTTALPRCRDPDDQKFLQLAWQGAADCLLSRDQALLELDRTCRRRGLFAITTPGTWSAADCMPESPQITSSTCHTGNAIDGIRQINKF